MQNAKIYEAQGFGSALPLVAPFALVIVDFVIGFSDDRYFGGGNINEAAERTVGLLSAARRRRWPVAHTRIVFSEDGSDANVFSDKVPNLLKLTETAEISQIIQSLTPQQGELVVKKTLPSGFMGTGLQPWLSRQAVRTVVVAGCTTSGCVRATVLDAMNFGFFPIVIRDCVGDRSIPPHEANLFDMQQKNADLYLRDEFLQRTEMPAAAQ